MNKMRKIDDLKEFFKKELGEIGAWVEVTEKCGVLAINRREIFYFVPKVTSDEKFLFSKITEEETKSMLSWIKNTDSKVLITLFCEEIIYIIDYKKFMNLKIKAKLKSRNYLTFKEIVSFPTWEEWRIANL